MSSTQLPGSQSLRRGLPDRANFTTPLLMFTTPPNSSLLGTPNSTTDVVQVKEPNTDAEQVRARGQGMAWSCTVLARAIETPDGVCHVLCPSLTPSQLNMHMQEKDCSRSAAWSRVEVSWGPTLGLHCGAQKRGAANVPPPPGRARAQIKNLPLPATLPPVHSAPSTHCYPRSTVMVHPLQHTCTARTP